MVFRKVTKHRKHLRRVPEIWWTRNGKIHENYLPEDREYKTGQKDWSLSLMIPLLKKGNPKMFKNYRTISLIRHTSKAMVRVVLNRIKQKSEAMLSEEQADFWPRRGT